MQQCVIKLILYIEHPVPYTLFPYPSFLFAPALVTFVLIVLKYPPMITNWACAWG